MAAARSFSVTIKCVGQGDRDGNPGSCNRNEACTLLSEPDNPHGKHFLLPY